MVCSVGMDVVFFVLIIVFTSQAILIALVCVLFAISEYFLFMLCITLLSIDV
jgi:hypothetical protein